MRAELSEEPLARCLRCGELCAAGSLCVEGGMCVRPGEATGPAPVQELAAELELHAEDCEGIAKTVRRLARELRREPDPRKIAEAHRWLR